MRARRYSSSSAGRGAGSGKGPISAGASLRASRWSARLSAIGCTHDGKRGQREDHAAQEVDDARDALAQEHAVPRHVEARRGQDHAARPEHDRANGEED